MERGQDRDREVRSSDELLAMVAHDLRNPLNTIVLSAELLLASLASDEGGQLSRPLRRIRSGADRLGVMLAQLVDLARIRLDGAIAIEPGPVDLRRVVEEAIDAVLEPLRGATAAPPIELDVRGDCAGDWDPERLGQVASTLIGNAVAHGEPAAAIAVVVDGSRRDEVVLEVRNAGAIPVEVLPRLFDPYRRLAAPAPGAPRARGLGLGLCVALHIVTAHGGRLDVRSSDNATAVTVALPRCQAR